VKFRSHRVSDLRALLHISGGSAEEKSPKPQYDSKGNLLRPADYRD